MNPRYPVYVLSYDRWQESRRLTIKALESMGVPYTVVIEPEEYDLYASVVPEKNIKIMPQEYHYNFDPCVPHEPNMRQGSGPVRNFIWDDAIKRGYARHWVFDDNIRHFYRLNNNRKILVEDGTMFRVMEDFCDRFENVALAGPQYEFFAPRKRELPPLILNTRVYSMLLIKNDIPYRWRSRYNDDTDLSLRVLKDGWCTVIFNMFLGKKMETQRVRGGLTDQIYMKEGTLLKSQTLKKLHPDVTTIIWKYNRWHHYVDYRPFKRNKLVYKPGVEIDPGVNDYGMQLIKRRRDNGKRTE